MCFELPNNLTAVCIYAIHLAATSIYLSTKRHLNVQKVDPRLRCFCTCLLPNVLRATTACAFSTSQWTSKSGPNPTCFVHFSLPDVLRATRACTFSTSQLPRVLRACFFFDVFWHFFLPNLLRAATACNFSYFIWPAGSAPAASASLLFDPPELRNIGKAQCFATLLPFRAPASSRVRLSPSLIFSLLTFSKVRVSSWLCFSSVHIVGSFTSKVPSMIPGQANSGSFKNERLIYLSRICP